MELNTGVWIWTIVLTPLVYCVYHIITFIIDVRTRGRAVDKLPGDPKHWLRGHLHLFPGLNEAGLQFMRERTALYPRVHGFFTSFLRPSVVVHHPETVKVILKTSEPKPSGFAGNYDYIKRWLGGGLALSSGDKWARNRRLLTPAFHFDVLKPYVVVKNRSTELLIEKMMPYASSGESFEFFSDLSLLTFDIILRCAFSYENDVQTAGKNHPYAVAVNDLSDLLMKRTLRPWLHFDFIYDLTSDGKAFNKACDYVHSIAEDVIRKRKKTLSIPTCISFSSHAVEALLFSDISNSYHPEQRDVHLYLWYGVSVCVIKHTQAYMVDYTAENSHMAVFTGERQSESSGKQALEGGRYLDFLDILLTARDEDGNGLSDIDIRDEVDTFLLAGHDTTSSAISWALYSLACNPEHQTLCQQEIDDLLEGRTDESITWEDLSKLTHLTLCIKESLRLHTPVSFIQRQTQKEVVIDGVTLPPRTVFDIQIYNLHHNPLVWEDPMEFRPSRFLPENIALKDNFAFVPFSAGPRQILRHTENHKEVHEQWKSRWNCIGQHFAMNEQKIVLARLLRKFTISLDPDFTVEKKISVVTQTQKGMFMKIARRC